MGSVLGNMVDSPIEKGYIFYGPSLTPPPNKYALHCSALNEVPDLGLSPNRNQSLEMVPKSPNFACKSQISPLYPDARAKSQIPNSVLRALTMFPKEMHHLTATPAKPKSDDNVLSLPPST